MQQAAPTALPVKNGKAPRPTGKHGAQPTTKTAFHAILAKATTAAKSDLKGLAASKAAHLDTALKGATVGKAHFDGLIQHGEKGEAKAAVAGRHQAKAKSPDLGHLGEAHLLSHVVEPHSATPEPEDSKKKVARGARHSDASAAGSLQMAAVVAHGLKDLPRLEPNRGEPAPTLAPTGQAIPVSHTAAKKAPEIRVHVVDLRKKHADSSPDDPGAAPKIAKAVPTDKEATAFVMPRDSGANDTTVRDTNKQPALPPSPFAAPLERLREMAGSELTRAAGIILREGGGEIKLTLKPESLGSVRIRMNLVDNAIEGRIIVDNAAVKHVFEGSLSSLMRAFTAEGFQTASLQVSVGGQNADTGRHDRENLPRVRRVESREAVGLDWNVPGAENATLGDLLVNLFV